MQGHCSQLHLACEEKYTLHMIVAAASPCTVTSKQCIPSENEINFSLETILKPLQFSEDKHLLHI